MSGLGHHKDQAASKYSTPSELLIPMIGGGRCFELEGNTFRFNKKSGGFLSSLWGYVGAAKMCEVLVGNVLTEVDPVKEVFPDLKAMKCCVINYLLGKEDISDEVVDAILAMGSDSFWVRVSAGERTRGFHPRTELSMCADVDDFRLEMHGDMYLAVGDKSK